MAPRALATVVAASKEIGALDERAKQDLFDSRGQVSPMGPRKPFALAGTSNS